MKLRHLLLILSCAFLFSRLVNLTLLPIFVDEANYLDWGWRETHTANFLFYSLYDAKPPFLMWLFGISQNFFPDPLFAGRLVVVLFGLLTLIGLYLISPPSSLLYLTSPIFYFFDRQALMESPLCAIGVWSYYFLTRYLEKPRLKYLLTDGAVIGLGIFTKTNAAIFLFPTLIILALQTLTSKSFTPATHSIFMLLTVALVLSPLLFQPQFWLSFSKNSLYSFSLIEILHFPLIFWLTNLWAYLQMAFWHLTPLIFLATVLGLFTRSITLKLWVVLPLLILIITSRDPNLRYLVPLLPLLLVPAAGFIFRHKIYLFATFAICLFVISILSFNPPFYFRLLNRLTPYSQIGEYLTGLNTGYLVNADLAFLRTLKPPVIIATAINSGNPEAALIDYLKVWPGFTSSYLDSRDFGPELNSADCLSSGIPVYFLARQQQIAGLDKFLAPVTVIHAPDTSDFHTIYTLKTGCPPEKTFTLTGSYY